MKVAPVSAALNNHRRADNGLYRPMPARLTLEGQPTGSDSTGRPFQENTR